ncbi:RING-finger protein [Pandoravirus inopinatum]|uniref:RING-finger protein n=1 Tax=Pandoravirus inopinatum TaxID=1605721 RepID=A0A0B5J1X6_9VIRU|nr:RING-finger protein [Pandoravirus inopinatum]AJF97554.1 RING-finger protein [Pandoravirus inopinatum]
MGSVVSDGHWVRALLTEICTVWHQPAIGHMIFFNIFVHSCSCSFCYIASLAPPWTIAPRRPYIAALSMYWHHRPDVGPSNATIVQDLVPAWSNDTSGASAKEHAWPDVCPVCYDAPAFYTTACNHAFCLDCLCQLATDSQRRRSCPLCRSPVLLKMSKGRMIKHAENGGRPLARRMLALLDMRPDDVLPVLAQDAALLFRTLEQHPGETLVADVASQLPRHFLPGAFALSMSMTRLANDVVPHALRCTCTVNAPHPIESPQDCRMTFKPATTRLVDVASVADHMVASVADALGIYHALRAVLRHIPDLGLPEAVVFRHLHPLQTTVTMTDGTVMNLLQYAVVDLLARHDLDAVRRWSTEAMDVAACPSLMRAIAGHSHPSRREQEMIIAALLSVHAGLSAHKTSPRWDREFAKLLDGDLTDTRQKDDQGGVHTFVGMVAAVDYYQGGCDDCSAARHEPKYSSAGRTRTVHIELLAGVVRAIRPTAHQSCLSDNGWMPFNVIMDQAGYRACDVDRTLDYLIDCGMVIAHERCGQATRYRYVG